MEAERSDHAQVIEINGPIPDVRNSEGSKICGEGPCGFADAGSISNDSEERLTSMRKLLIAVVLCITFMTVEIVGGIKANSLAILTDAAHLLSDVAAFAISLFSLWAAGWEATPRQSYGFFRIEILGALVSIQMIWLLAGILVYEAIDRIIAGPRELYVIVLGTTINMLRNILEVLMESTPREIDATQLERGLLEMEEVVAVHELHIWAITVGKVLLASHVKIRPEANADLVLDKVINYIKRVYNISHITIQIER
ncbi:putative cation efflux protein [Lupinus albus]|uniref:Putative cation efflux protein n=1 Tax=Lupinus albus TaxID=3870 RepID=A0A6A4PPA9_LUPAL|nr:putative cation efflux protein [Lupinus albus]